jgi:hypothetical protein
MKFQMNDTLQEYLKMAYPICLSIPRQKKHVSLILHKNKIVSVGTNSFKTHPKAKEIGYHFEEMHSELEAYQRVPFKIKKKKLTLVNVRFNRFGEMRMSRPCELCSPWCREIFNEIYYTTDEGLVRMD